jgi:hypothetical protein
MRIYIKNKLFLEKVDLTLNNFHLGKVIRGRERTCDEELRNITKVIDNVSV